MNPKARPAGPDRPEVTGRAKIAGHAGITGHAGMAGRPAMALAALLAATALGGCSSARELRTQGQAAGFAVEVAGGEPAGNWSLASKPTPEALQAWTDRRQIADLGRRLRTEGNVWTCEFAHQSVSLGSIGYFNQHDSGIVSREAAAMGIDSKRISATLRDVVALRYRELVLVTTSICGPYKGGG